jgi:hypothetical protein
MICDQHQDDVGPSDVEELGENRLCRDLNLLSQRLAV